MCVPDTIHIKLQGTPVPDTVRAPHRVLHILPQPVAHTDPATTLRATVLARVSQSVTQEATAAQPATITRTMTSTTTAPTTTTRPTTPTPVRKVRSTRAAVTAEGLRAHLAAVQAAVAVVDVTNPFS